MTHHTLTRTVPALYYCFTGLSIIFGDNLTNFVHSYTGHFSLTHGAKTYSGPHLNRRTIAAVGRPVLPLLPPGEEVLARVPEGDDGNSAVVKRLDAKL